MESFDVNLENLSEEEQDQLVSLIEKSNKPQNKRWRAKTGGTHYYIDASGDIECDIDNHTRLDDAFFNIGNYYKNQEDANFEVERRFICQELYDYALDNDEKVDWNDDSYKYFLSYNEATQTLFASYTQKIRQPNTVYFTFEENLHKAVEKIGEDRIKKYLFGVEE